MRAWARPRLTAFGADGCVPDALVVLSELVTNAITHGHGPVEVTLKDRGPAVRMTVRDQGHSKPKVHEPSPDASSGRGLVIVDRLSASWGVDSSSNKTTVWADITN